jgi:serine/threonine protein phosphatase PrpC
VSESAPPPERPDAASTDPVDPPDPTLADGADAGPVAAADPAEAASEVSSAPAADLPASGGPALSFGFNLGKIAGEGEDSDPILRDGRELGLVAVFDGMGGAGGTVYETPDGPRTGAYLASRVARDVVEQRMVALLDPDWNLDGPATAADLQRSVRAALQERLAELRAPASGLRSRLLRALPTTMAVVALQRRERDGDRWFCHLFWAGDSRAYVFEPDGGAQQLTVDDIRDHGDAMANLREDSVVSNAVSADTDFVVHHRKVELTAPFLVIAATDGCFGYVPSPMHFEHLVLAALRDAPDTDSWSAALQAGVSAVTGDDAAMATLGVGADHDTFRELFARRTAELEERWITPLDDLDADLREHERKLDELRRARRERQAQLWAAYKPGYERYLGPATMEGTP